MDEWEIEARAAALFSWYPLTGLVNLTFRYDEPDFLTTDRVICPRKHLVALRCDPDKVQVPENCEVVEIPDCVVWAMQGHDSSNPVYTLYRDTDNASRLESEINQAARQVVQALVA
jgi:hypothetical protein